MQRSRWSSDLWPLLRAVAVGAAILVGVVVAIRLGAAALELVAMR